MIKIWLADLTYTQQVIASETMPAAIGCVGTFARARVRAPTEIRVFKYPEKFIEALDRDWPHLIGFSNYAWNAELSFAFARAIKVKRPATVTVAGGPNYPIVPSEQEAFMRGHPEIDFYVIREGEVAFACLVESLIERDWDIEACKTFRPGVHSVGASGGTFYHSEPAGRLRDLTVIPSPYLARASYIGRFSELNCCPDPLTTCVRELA